LRKLFVSYARENKPHVDQLVEHLRTMGYDTWVDAALRGGQDWWDEILDRIADTDVVIAIYSSAVLNSTACGREFEWAAALGKPVIPVAVEPPPTALPRRFARRQIIDYSQPAQRDRAALQLQGALATVPPAPPLPDPLPEPPAAPLSYLTDLIDLITQTTAVDHDQQHQILRQLEPALTSFDPLEWQGGRDILERFSRRPDLYADVDRTITRLRKLSDQPAPAHGEPSTQTTAKTAEQTEVQVDVGESIGATTAHPVSAPASPLDAEFTHQDEPALETDDVAAHLAGTRARGADADTREKTTEDTPTGGSDTQAGVRAADEPAHGLKPFAQSDEKPEEVDTGRTLFQRLSRRTKIIGAAAAGALVVIIALVAIVASQSGSSSDTSAQVKMPFTGLSHPEGVAVDSARSVYVVDSDHHRVLKLPAGATTPVELPFTGLGGPVGVAVDSAGNVYVTDSKGRVLKLAAGATTPTELPFTGLSGYLEGVAVDNAGVVYVTDAGNKRVLKLSVGETTQTELPFTGLSGPRGVAVDSAGIVYITDWANKQVLKLAAGMTTQTELPFTGLSGPDDVAVDSAGNVYVTDSKGRVLKLAAGATTSTELPFTGLNDPHGVAVDSAGNVYVTDYEYGDVVKLPAH
jgi:DNA-binding beta-propeller fold protein YncE